MTTERKVSRAKVGLLELAKQLGNTDPPPGIRAWGSWPKERSAKYWPSKKPSRTKACPREAGGALLPGAARSRGRAQAGRNPPCLPACIDLAVPSSIRAEPRPIERWRHPRRRDMQR